MSRYHVVGDSVKVVIFTAGPRIMPSDTDPTNLADIVVAAEEAFPGVAFRDLVITVGDDIEIQMGKKT